MRSLAFIILALPPLGLLAQNQQLDDERYKAAVEWLDSKLNYLYFDKENQRWWNNTFYVNEDKEVTIKHIASERPNTANIGDKTYTIRTFQMQDINPNSLKVSKVKESRGRIVKGQMLELRTFGYQNSISKTISNKRASSTSYLFLSFPTSLADSASNYAQVVKEKFKEAINASTQVYATEYEQDIRSVLSILAGEFASASGSIWKAKVIKPNVLALNRGNGQTEYFGYDTNDRRFYLVTLSNLGIDIQYFRLQEENLLTLSDESENTVFLIENLNAIQFEGEEYFRQ